MDNTIQKEFNFTGLIRFSFPTVAMMVFMSMYTVVDGVFVARFVGTNALSSLNIAYPLFNAVLALGVMLGAGGSALIAKKMGEEKWHEAKQNFSLIIYAGIIVGVIITVLGIIFMEPIMRLLGADDLLLQGCLDYGYILLFFSVPTMLQMIFQYLFITAGKPHFGLVLTFIAGITNIVFDYIFIVPLDMGIKGAALATGMGITIPAVAGLLLFSFQRKGSLCFVRTRLDFSVLLHSCGNGASEMVTELSNAIITFLYNIVMMRLLGADGVAAITILLYLDFLLKAALLGFSMGVAPIISYNYGSQNIPQIQKIFKYCIFLVVSCSAVMFLISVVFAPVLTSIFAPEGSYVHTLAMSGFRIYCISFLFTGVSIFSSAMFTAFSNGRVSATISFLRTFFFLAVGLMVLPPLIGVTGAWVSAGFAEGFSMIMSVIFLYRYRNIYHYTSGKQHE